MQIFPSAPVRLLIPRLLIWPLSFVTLLSPTASGAPTAAPKTHVVALGAVRKVPFTPPGLAPSSANSDKPAAPTDALILKVRPLIVDGRQKEWTTGDAHDVTDRSFTIRRALRLNDQLPTDDCTTLESGSPAPGCSSTAPPATSPPCIFPTSTPRSPTPSGSATTPPTAASPPPSKAASSPSSPSSARAEPSSRSRSAHGPSRLHSDPVCKPAQWQRTAHARHPPAHRRRPHNLRRRRRRLPHRRRRLQRRQLAQHQ